MSKERGEESNLTYTQRLGTIIKVVACISRSQFMDGNVLHGGILADIRRKSPRRPPVLRRPCRDPGTNLELQSFPCLFDSSIWVVLRRFAKVHDLPGPRPVGSRADVACVFFPLLFFFSASPPHPRPNSLHSIDEGR